MVSSAKWDRSDLLRLVGYELGREMSARSVMYLQAVAERLGINATDLKCLDLAVRSDAQAPLTAGDLARLTGLTTGAVTGVLDRLERAGFVRRERDPADRRRVAIRLLARRERETTALFSSLGRSYAALAADYDDRELAVLHDFMTRSIAVLKEETARLHPRTRGRKSRR